jgi:ATP-dependent 26S proteasome regulatory subunit
MFATRRADSQAERPVASGESEGLVKKIVVELVLTVISAALSFLVIQQITKRLPGGGASDPTQDPRRNASAARKRLKDGRSKHATFNAYEDIIAGDMVFPDEIDVTFGDVGGHDRDKKEIYDLICLPLKHPELFARLAGSELLSPPRGLLLYGPPGTGKTMLAKAIAKESGAAFINLKMSTTMNLYFGESQKLVRATFSLAKKLSPCIIFIDEIDSFLHERKTDDNSALGNMKAEFMALWDGIETDTDSNGGHHYGVVVIGATNRPWDVDAAILRRMPRSFEMGLPDIVEREKILRLVLRSEALDASIDLKRLAQECEGYSGSDLKELCRAAAAFPYREFVSNIKATSAATPDVTMKMRALRRDDFEEAKRMVKPSGESASDYHQRVQREGFNGRGRQESSVPLTGSDETFLAGVQYGLHLAKAQAPVNGAASKGDGGRGGKGEDVDLNIPGYHIGYPLENRFSRAALYLLLY